MEKEKKPKDHLLDGNGKQCPPLELMLFFRTWRTICVPFSNFTPYPKASHTNCLLHCAHANNYSAKTIQKISKAPEFYRKFWLTSTTVSEVETVTTYFRSYLIDFVRCRGN